MAEAEPRYTVLNRRDVVTFPRMGEPTVTVYVTYVTENLAPGIVKVPKKEWSPEAEAKAIRADIDDRLRRSLAWT